MKTKNKLLSITSLKKYFPIAKSSIFQKEQLYVKANEDISMDIYEGETIGVVGESGCGKSTFGRVLLQLYDQTAGETMYYGKSIAEVAPSYIKDTLLHIDKYIKKYNKLNALANKYKKQIDEAGGEDNADFYLLQNKNLAVSQAKTELSYITKIIGGFFGIEDRKDGVKKNLEIYKLNVKYISIEHKLEQLKKDIDYYNNLLLNSTDKKEQALNKKIDSLNNKYNKTKNEFNFYKNKFDIALNELKELKNKFKDNPEFQKYEQCLDDGIDLARLKYNEIRPLRKDLQIIFQDPYSSLNPRMTVGQIIEEGLLTHNFFHKGNKNMQKYILEVMEKCGLQDYMLHRYPHQFSGGQRQRICIARALAVQPKFVVCDECVSALDVSIQSQIINLLEKLQKENNLTFLFISHDLSVVKYISDRICVMYLGNVVEFADKNDIFDDPRHPYTISLLSSIPTTDIDSLSKERILLEGNIPSPIKPPTGCKFHTRCFMCTEKCKRIPPKLTEITPGHFVACHYPEKKIDEQGKYLFKTPKMVKKTAKINN